MGAAAADGGRSGAGSSGQVGRCVVGLGSLVAGAGGGLVAGAGDA